MSRDAVASTGLDFFFAGMYGTQGVIYRTAQAADSFDDRVHGASTTATQIKVRDFATGTKDDYGTDAGSEANLPAADPAAKRFGFGRAKANLVASETHKITEDTSTYSWDEDNDVWQQTDAGTLAAGDGINIITNVGGVEGDVTTGGDVAAVSVGVNGVGVDVTALDGDHVTLDFVPANYTRTTTGVPEAANIQQLAAHLKGIDNALATIVTPPVARQEELTTENISGADTAMGDTLNNSPVSTAAVRLKLNGVHMRQATHYSVGGGGNQTITWLALSSGFAQKNTDFIVVVYDS